MIRTCLLLAMTLIGVGLLESDHPARPANLPGMDAVALNPLQATRLRKLHLVRPDLINYPLSFDVVC